MDVIIVGAGGHGTVVCDILRSTQSRVIAFVDHDAAKFGTRVLDIPVFGSVDEVPAANGASVAMGIGDNAARRTQFEQLRSRGFHLLRVIHPSAVLSTAAHVGEGTVIMPNVVVNVGAIVGENVILNTACSIDHHCIIGDHAHVAPGVTVAGGGRIGQQALVGAGAVMIPGAIVGERAIVGAGAVVLHDVPADATFVGVPAKGLSRGETT